MGFRDGAEIHYFAGLLLLSDLESAQKMLQCQKGLGTGCLGVPKGLNCETVSKNCLGDQKALTLRCALEGETCKT